MSVDKEVELTAPTNGPVGYATTVLGSVIALAGIAWGADLYRQLGMNFLAEQFLAVILGLAMSIVFLAAIIVGGMGTQLGAVLGATFMTLVPELLKLIVDVMPGGASFTVFLSPVRTIVFGLLIIGFLVFEPQGLAEVWRRIRRFFHLWPFRT